MKLLHVIPSLAATSGGPAINCVALCQQMNKLGHQTTIATTDALTPARSAETKGGAALADFPNGAEELDLRVFPLKHPYSFTYAPQLGRFLDQHISEYDLVHVHSLNLYPQLVAWRAAQRDAIPVVLSPRGALDPWIRGKRRMLKQLNDRLWQRQLLDGAAAIHLTTDDELHLIEPMKLKAPKLIIPNAFDVADFARPGDSAWFRDQWLNGYQGFVVLNHGRLSEKKGLNILVAALPTIRHSTPVRLVLIGADDEGIGSLLRDQAARLGVGNDLTIIPHLEGDGLRNAIAASDVWVLPSYTENFGMAVVEAMAARRSVITSPNVNIAPEAATANALFMVPNTVDNVAAAILELLANPDQRVALGVAAARYIWKFDWSIVAREFEGLYQNAIWNNGSREPG